MLPPEVYLIPMSLRRIAAGLALVAVLAPSTAMAAQPRADETIIVPREETVTDNVYAAGETVTIGGTINGNVVAAAQTITIDGTINGDLWLAARSITISGTVTGSVHLASEAATVSGTVGGDVLSATGTTTIAKGATVARDVWIASGKSEVNGTVGRDFKVSASEAAIAGTIAGNVEAKADSLRLADGSRIGGSLEYTAPQEVDKASSATVAGATDYKPKEKKRENFGARLAGQLLFFLFSMLLLAGILLYARRAASLAAGFVFSKPGWSALAGLAFLIAGPIAITLLLVTVVGIPLGLISLFGYVLVLYSAKLFVALAVGYQILQRRADSFFFAFGAGVLGLALFYILSVLPVVGFLLSLAVMLLGTGAQLLLFRQFYADNRKKYGA